MLKEKRNQKLQERESLNKNNFFDMLNFKGTIKKGNPLVLEGYLPRQFKEELLLFACSGVL